MSQYDNPTVATSRQTVISRWCRKVRDSILRRAADLACDATYVLDGCHLQVASARDNTVD